MVIDQAGSGSKAQVGFAGSSSVSAAATLRMCKADGTLGVPYDSVQVMLSDMGAASSIESMRITSSAVIVPNTLDIGGYIDLDTIDEPAAPAAGKLRIYVDSHTGDLSVKNSAGTTVALTTF